MNFKYNISKIAFSALFSLVLVGCSKSDMADINTNPQEVSEMNIKYGFSEALILGNHNDYLDWIYNYSRVQLPWTQAVLNPTSNGEAMNRIGNFVPQENKIFMLKKQIEAVNHTIDKNLSGDIKESYRYLQAALKSVQVFFAIYSTDTYGSMAYEEVGLGLLQPELLQPKYHSQAELFDIWLKELNTAIETLTNPVASVVNSEKNVTQNSPGSQDIIYKGDFKKWAKFANSVKLKLAVRLLNHDKTRAFAIAKEVTEHKAGYMSDTGDDYIYHVGSQSYNFGNAVGFGAGSKDFIAFLVKNKDPRVLSLFEKNTLTSAVVNRFLEEDIELPAYITDLVNIDIATDGTKSFGSWKAPGEPWVRYHGAPIDINASKDASINDQYFNGNKFKLSRNKKDKTYTPISIYNQEMIRGENVKVYPSLPEENAVEDNTKRGWYSAHMTSGEVNLYLAEFKLLGANITGNAETYFTQGITNSVKVMDFLADKNKIPYYEEHAGFDAEDKTIKLTNEMLSELLNRPDYQLTGTREQQFEKIYMQQYIHALQNPNEQFVLVRRSGFPYKDGELIQRIPFDKQNLNYAIPRKYRINPVLESDLMYNIKMKAYQEQGFTVGTDDPNILKNERVWYDLQAPEYGERPKR